MPNPVLSSLILPVKDTSTGTVTNITYDLPAGGGGGSITVDDALSTTSENPVQNKVITSALNNKADSSSVPANTSDLLNDSGFVSFTDLTKDAASGATSVAFTNAAITSTKNYELFSTVFTNITGMSISGTTLTVTFQALSSARTFKLRIS